MRETAHILQLGRYMNQKQSAPTTEPPYEPPRVEVIVTASELERESLYAGAGAYGGGA